MTAAVELWRVRDVGRRGGGGAAGRVDEVEGVAQLVSGAGDERHRGAGLGEGPGDELPDASSGAGHERHRSVQTAAVLAAVGDVNTSPGAAGW